MAIRPLRLCIVFSVIASAQTQTRTQRISAAADALNDQVIAQRRDFHRHPELSNREERTARVIAERLRAIGLEEVKTGVGKHGIVALLKGGRPGPVVAWRADMDALPVTDSLDTPYKSQNPGVHHACGHDAHMAIALGVAEAQRCAIRSTVPSSLSSSPPRKVRLRARKAGQPS